MYIFIIVIHIIACLILITAILLQPGKGAGLSGLFGGGGATQTIFGARASTFLTRATQAAAITFLLTCIGLTVFASRRGKSLMRAVEEKQAIEQALPEAASQEAQQEEQGTKPEENKQEEPEVSEAQPKEAQE